MAPPGPPQPQQPHGVDHYDATFARDLRWSQRLREQLDELPTTPGPDLD
ncbi:hypothetical protein GCM10027271_36530 [Saccharopolyspora gloriosae]|uniref:Uncharacterized protein n=1 Tax=Saccharopolyspora gloriosae TaxID=455344 RepID=A0A840NGU7_9PSEU|nr:hypothetical protein [Saccharopolyspora gloriosae]MBB5069453.1 hypothetical protein [Saccharopolyspora gloriosae]